MQDIKEKYNEIVRDLGRSGYYSPKDREERLQKIIEREAEAKEKTLIARVNKEVGIIEQAIELYVGVNGELNGMIKGEKGTCKIGISPLVSASSLNSLLDARHDIVHVIV